jgi:hypothetical protein
VSAPENELLDQAVAFAEMWGTEQNWPHVRDAYVAAILRDRATRPSKVERLSSSLTSSPRPPLGKSIPNYPEYDNARNE